MKLSIAAFLAVLVMMVPTPASAAESGSNSELWHPGAETEPGSVALYFVYSETCQHCSAAKPLIEDIEAKYSWLEVVRVSTQSATDAEIDTVLTLADQLGEDIVGVPTFLFCERMEVGFDSIETTGASIESSLLACHEQQLGETVELEDLEDDLHVPILGDIDAEAVSLPIFTVAIAGLDAFNPCAFFVLLFLLSLLVHARSRWRMALVGGVFVLISGVMYFAFMAAWLNVFLVTGQIRWVTTIAGLIALALAIFNMKDYFFPDTAGSISIPDSAKPGLFARMRKLTTGDAMPTVLLGTVALAAVANSYELLCTAGFPLVFTRVLTLNDLPTSTYYGYLVLYNVVYVIPLLVIVGVFVWTLGSRKLSETEGRFLKLMSGTMMFGLALLLLFKPDLLENMLAAVGIMGVAVLTAFLLSYADRRRHSQPRPNRVKPG